MTKAYELSQIEAQVDANSADKLTPPAYGAGDAGKAIAVRATEDGWELATLGGGSLAYTELTKTFALNEEYDIALSPASENPLVTVQKAVAAAGSTQDHFTIPADYQTVTLADYAYAETLTLSALTGDITATLATGPWVAADVGRAIRAGTGIGIITAVNAAIADVTVVTDFAGTSLTSGNWSLEEVTIQGGVMSVAGYSFSAGGFQTSADKLRYGNLDGAAYASKSFSVAGQTINPEAFAFNNDGTKVYVMGQGNLHQYTLSTAWDVSTAVYDSVSFVVTAQATSMQAFAFNGDGSKLYLLTQLDAIYQYTLSTPFDISNVTYDTVSVDISGQVSNPWSMKFNNDGTKLYVLDLTTDTIFQYSLSTPYLISTAVYDTVSHATTAQETSPKAIEFNSNGTKMYVSGPTNAYQYTLTTPFDLSTAVYDSVVLSMPEEGDKLDIALSTDGSNLYSIGPSGDTIHQYSTAQFFAIQDGAGFSVTAQETNVRGVSFNADGTKMYIAGHTGANIWQYSLSTPYDVNTAVYDSVSFSIVNEGLQPMEVEFSPDGTNMYVLSFNTLSIFQYTLSTAFDVSTASYASASLSISAQEATPGGMDLSPDGTKVYVLGTAGDSIFQYDMSTPFDLSTATYNTVFLSVVAQTGSAFGFSFNSDGTYLVVVTFNTYDVLLYELSTPYVVSSATYVREAFNVGGQDQTPYSLFFNNDDTKIYMTGNDDAVFQYDIYAPELAVPSQRLAVTQENDAHAFALSPDGTKLYVVGPTTDTVFQFTLSTPYSISTATYDAVSVSISAVTTFPTGLTFSPDGTKMFVASGSVHTYVLSTPFNVGTATNDSKSFVLTGQDADPYGVIFNNDGTKMYLIGIVSDSVHQYTLGTAWDVTTATYDSVALDVSAQESAPTGMAFNADGTELYVVGATESFINQYTLSTAFDVSTATYSGVRFGAFTAADNPHEIVLADSDSEFYVLCRGTDTIHQYTMGTTSTSYKTGDYVAAIDSSAVDTSLWLDLDNVTSTDAVNGEFLSYAFSTDGRATWFVTQAAGDRNIVRDNLGTWEYNSNVTYASETWTPASVNTELAALEEAQSVAQNNLTPTELSALLDAELFALTTTLDFAVVLRTDTATASPSFTNLHYDYESQSNQVTAVNGTDYTLTQLGGVGSSIRIKALAANNLKVKVL